MLSLFLSLPLPVFTFPVFFQPSDCFCSDAMEHSLIKQILQTLSTFLLPPFLTWFPPSSSPVSLPLALPSRESWSSFHDVETNRGGSTTTSTNKQKIRLFHNSCASIVCSSILGVFLHSRLRKNIAQEEIGFTPQALWHR